MDLISSILNRRYLSWLDLDFVCTELQHEEKGTVSNIPELGLKIGEGCRVGVHTDCHELLLEGWRHARRLIRGPTFLFPTRKVATILKQAA